MDYKLDPYSTTCHPSDLDRTGHLYPFQGPAWLRAWSKVFQVEMFILQVGSWSVPVYIEQSFGARVLKIAGGSAADYHCDNCESVLFSDLQNALENLSKNYSLDAFVVDRLPAPPNRPRSELLKFDHYPFWESSHQLSLSGESFDCLYEKKVPSKTRSDSARQRRRLDEIGPVSFRVAKTQDEALQLLKSTIELKKLQHARQRTPSIFNNDKWLNFYFEITRAHWKEPGDPKQTWVHASGLYVGDELVATHWGLVDDEVFYYLMPAYKMDVWGRFSPGRVLLLELLKWSAERKLKSFDFTIGDEPYKELWCDVTTPLYQVVQSFTARGKLYALIKQIHNKLRSNPSLAPRLLKAKHFIQRYMR